MSNFDYSSLPPRAFCVKTVFSKRRRRTLSAFSCVWAYIMKTLRALVRILGNVLSTAVPYGFGTGEIVFSRKNPRTRRVWFFHKKISSGKIISFARVVMCEDFSFPRFLLVFGSCVVVCEDFDFFKNPCVWAIWNFVPVSERFVFSDQKSMCWGFLWISLSKNKNLCFVWKSFRKVQKDDAERYHI